MHLGKDSAQVSLCKRLDVNTLLFMATFGARMVILDLSFESHVALLFQGHAPDLSWPEALLLHALPYQLLALAL